MRPGLVLFTVLLLAFAGCSSEAPAPSTSPSPTPTPPSTPPVEAFSHEANNPQCTEVLTTPYTAEFTVPENYTRIEVIWHAQGVGQVGFEIKNPNGTVIVSKGDENPATACGAHAHPPGQVLAVAPGTFDLTVRNTGAIGWLLIVTALGPEGNATHPDHD